MGVSINDPYIKKCSGLGLPDTSSTKIGDKRFTWGIRQTAISDNRFLNGKGPDKRRSVMKKITYFMMSMNN
jgi:hypothetical protein